MADKPTLLRNPQPLAQRPPGQQGLTPISNVLPQGMRPASDSYVEYRHTVTDLATMSPPTRKEIAALPAALLHASRVVRPLGPHDVAWLVERLQTLAKEAMGRATRSEAPSLR